MMETEPIPAESNIESDSTQKEVAEKNEEHSRLGRCEVCQTVVAKYTCPRCEVKTCSLKCSKIHKFELECDGSRDRTRYVALKKFTNLDLSSDYRLLEEITRSVESYKKDRLKKFTRINRDLPYHLSKLHKAAATRKTTLKFLPANFARHKNNSSRINFSSNVVYWHIDWIFVNADHFLLQDEKVSENEKLSILVNKYLVKQENPVLKEKLEYYNAAGLSGVKLFLKAEMKGGNKYYELDPSLSLKDNLSDKIVIEYPIIHVVLNYHCDCYDVVNSDDENDKVKVDTKKKKSGYEVIASLIKKEEKEENLYKSIKNLLFISEYSDTELSDA